MTLKPYLKYKPSGVEWLGDVPAHWHVMMLKWMAVLHRGYDLTDSERVDGIYPVVTSGGPIGTHNAFMAPGPGVVTGRYGSTGTWYYVEPDFWPHNTSLYVCDFRGNHRRFVWYAMQAIDVKVHSSKSAVPGIDRNDLHVTYVVLPTLADQSEIVKFLDREAAKIDTLIAKQEKLIELLQEKRQAVISHAVTKGLNPTVPMKPSGVEWLGDVPEHWWVGRNKVLFAEIDDRSNDGDEELLTVSHITGVTLRSEKNVNMFLAETLEGYKRCQTGDLVINTMWAWMGALGISPHRGLVSPSYNVYRPRSKENLSPRYYDYLCRIASHVVSIKANSTGIWESRLRLYPGAFLSMSTCLPPMQEQEEISSYLDRTTKQIDTLIAKAQQAIELQKEHRTALISAAVTGKINVRGIVDTGTGEEKVA